MPKECMTVVERMRYFGWVVPTTLFKDFGNGTILISRFPINIGPTANSNNVPENTALKCSGLVTSTAGMMKCTQGLVHSSEKRNPRL